MPNQWDLTGENIENTYQRVLQTPDGVNIFDGTGSAFTVTVVAAPAGPDQSVQFNDAGTTSGSGNFIFDKSNNTVTLTGSLNITGSTTQIGNISLLGNTLISGSIVISGSLGQPNPTISIFGDLNQTGYTRYLPVTTNLDTSLSASYIFVSGSTQDLYFSQNGAGYANTTRLRWIEGNLYTGLLNGGLIGSSSSTVFTVSSGSGIIVNLNASFNNNPYPTIQYVNWGNLSASIAPLSASFDQQFVAINSSSQIVVQGTPFNDGQFNTLIPVGLVLHQNHSTINGVKTSPSLAYGYKQRTYDFIKAFGPLKISGYTVLPSGSSTGSLTVGNGAAFVDGANYALDPNNPSYAVDNGTTTSKIFRYYQSGSDWVYNTNNGAGYAALDPVYYNPGGLGILDLVGASNYSLQRCYWYPNSVTKAITVYYGNEKYGTLAQAIAAIASEPFTEAPNTAANAVYLGTFAIKGGTNTTLQNSTHFTWLPGGLFRGNSGGGGSGGGGGTPGGTPGEIQYNNLGAFDGVPTLTYDGTTLRATGSFSGSLHGTASYADNGGVTGITAGNGISINQSTGNVTITSIAASYNTATGSYGSFYDTSSQTNPVINVPRSMSFNTTDISNGVSISGSTNPYNTYIKVTNTGVYDIQFSAQFDRTTTGTDIVYIWLRKNGVDIPQTNTSIVLTGGAAANPTVAAWNWFVNANAGDYYQLMWSAPDTHIQILATTPPYGPAVPSVIVTANRVDTFLSNTGSFSGSFTGILIGTASWANSASYYQETDPVFTAKSASLATTGSNTFIGNQVVSGSFIIDTSSSDAALRVTQTGTGEAIRVEDSTNPDATPFVIDATGRVGIGTSTPQYAIVASSSTATDTVMFFDGGTAANANLVAAADTTIKIPSLVLWDRTAGAYSTGVAAYIGIDRSSSLASPVYANRNDMIYVNNFLNAGHYFVTNNGGAKAVRMVISGSGNVGIGTTTPTASLHISSSQVNGGVVIETSSSIASLRVTQVGDGNAILVEDSANPDSTPFVVASDGRVGIGVTAPLSTYKLHVRNGAVTNSSTWGGSVGVFENSGSNAYLSVLSSDTYTAGVGFGTAAHRVSANVNWNSTTKALNLATNTASAFLTFGTDVGTERMRITSGGLVGIGTTIPQYMLDVSGSARVTSSLYLPGLTTTAQNNVVTVDTSTGQLYYTASSAFGGGSSTPTFPYTGSAIISGSLTVTGSLNTNGYISSYKSTASQEVFSTTAYVAGDIIQGTVSGPTQWDLVYLDIDGTWKDVNQTTSTSTKMLGIYLGGDQILLDGHISATTNGVGTPIGPSVQNPDQGLPVYIDLTPSQYNTTIPTSDYVRTLGYLYYNNAIDANYWILKFRPSNDWYKI